MSLGGYSGTAGDILDYCANSLSTKKDPRFCVIGMKFTTRDRDNDMQVNGNCADMYHAGWWLNDCSCSNLNSRVSKEWPYMRWCPLGRTSYSEMKIKYN